MQSMFSDAQSANVIIFRLCFGPLELSLISGWSSLASWESDRAPKGNRTDVNGIMIFADCASRL